MDWTGGTRRRFAGAKNNNAALQRQKAHFARARAAIQHEPFSSHQRAQAVDHNDDTRARSYKGSGRGTVTSGRDGRTKTNLQHAGTTSFVGNAQPRQDEELHLLASRRKLLARNDWLALDHTRPLRIGFPTAGDKDRVGRRRKIKTSSETRTKAARPRLLTPLFEERLEPNAYHMSGARSPEHNDHVEVRVGTSAFETQSRPSQKLNTSRNASMGAQSIALSHLSEESMLLGADGDSFDADQVEVPAYTRDVRDAVEGINVRPASFDSGEYEVEEVDRHSRAVREYSLASDVDPELQQYRAKRFDGNNPSISSLCHITEPDIRISSMVNYTAPDSTTGNTVEMPQDYDCDDLDRNVMVDPLGMAIPGDQYPLEIDAEQEWRHLMGIVTQSESSASRKALDSSSEHVTTSESLHRVILGDVQHGAGINGAISNPMQHIRATNDVHTIQAPGGMLVASTPPPHPHGDAEDNTDNEALWREFIIGSQDSDSGDELHSAWKRSRERMRQSSEQPQSVQVSGLGTSDQATKGEAIVYSPNALTAQAVDGVLDQDTESIEEFPLDDIPPSTSPRNIHATSTKRLDPRRFKISKDGEGNLTRRESHAVSRRNSSRRFSTNQGRI